MKFSFPTIQNLDELKRILDNGMQRLKLDENFQNFVAVIQITAGQEIGIPNRLKTIPSKRIIVRQTGNGNITDGDTPWTQDRLYIKNHGPETTMVTLLFLE